MRYSSLATIKFRTCIKIIVEVALFIAVVPLLLQTKQGLNLFTTLLP
jgi:hypothetical protein